MSCFFIMCTEIIEFFNFERKIVKNSPRFEKDIKVHILNIGLIEDTSTGRMSAFAGFERNMIV